MGHGACRTHHGAQYGMDGCTVGECSGMVSFKEPIKHWMVSLEEEDKYKHLKADENELRSKIG